MSLRRSDLLSLCNLRNDGRKGNEIRKLNIEMSAGNGISNSSCYGNGTALIEMGLTQVLVSVRGPMDCNRRSDERNDRGILDVQIKVPPFASAMDRRTVSSNDRRIMELSNQLLHIFESAVLLHLFPKSKIEITVCVLADDGSRLCASINATTLALMDAGIPMKDFVIGCTAGHSDGGGDDAIIIDLNRREEMSNTSNTNTYAGKGGGSVSNAIGFLSYALLPQRGTVVLTQCESARLPDVEALTELMNAAKEGCHDIFQRMQVAIREHASTLLTARQGHAQITNVF